ncbi:hypothetical protein AB0I28_36185 [Phytomonospora sp. NPDC050363]|uniref:hypothetical protein n=1 Tax=Phytomonospora sp. NPDC050363 TaxID=3155642 RepID=UPI0033DDE727
MSTKLPRIDTTWMFDLVSDDPRQRGVALARNDLANNAYLIAADAYGDVWRTIWSLRDDGGDVPAHLVARCDQVERALTEATEGTLNGLAAKFADSVEEDDHEFLAPYAAIFLTLENRYPDTWEGEAPATPPWGLKKRVLRRFERQGVPDNCRAMIAEAVMDAAFRLQRREDHRYPQLARLVDSPALRDDLAEAEETEDVVVAARAGYLLWTLENPAAPVGTASWRDWLVSGL